MNQGKKEPTSSFNEVSEDDIYLEERNFDGETREEKKYREVILDGTRKRKYQKEMKERNKNGILPPEVIMEENLNHQRLRNKLNNKK